MNTLLKWLVTSSANPENVSMTLKGILAQHLGFIMIVVSTFNLPIAETQIYALATVFITLVGSCLAIIGAIRKGYYLFK